MVNSYRARSGFEIRGKAPKHQTNIMSFSETSLLWKKQSNPQSKVDTLLPPALSPCLGDMVVRMRKVIATIRGLNEFNELTSKQKYNSWIQWYLWLGYFIFGHRTLHSSRLCYRMYNDIFEENLHYVCAEDNSLVALLFSYVQDSTQSRQMHATFKKCHKVSPCPSR